MIGRISIIHVSKIENRSNDWLISPIWWRAIKSIAIDTWVSAFWLVGNADRQWSYFYRLFVFSIVFFFFLLHLWFSFVLCRWWVKKCSFLFYINFFACFKPCYIKQKWNKINAVVSKMNRCVKIKLKGRVESCLLNSKK